MGTLTVAAKPTKALSQEIQRVVSKNLETKYVVSPLFNTVTGPLNNWASFTSAITSTNEMYCCLPSIQIGSGDHNRIGAEVAPKSLTVKGWVTLDPGVEEKSYGSNDIEVHMFFLTSKQIKSEAHWTEVDVTQLLNTGVGNNTSFDGSTYKSLLDVNRSDFNLIKRKVIRLRKSWGNPDTQRIGGTMDVTSFDTPKYNAKFSVKIPVPKKLKYTTDGTSVATNFYPFMVAGFCIPNNADGAQSFDYTRFHVLAQSHLYYKDA